MQKIWYTYLFFIPALLFVNQASATVVPLSVVTEEAISLQYRSEITNEMEGPAAVMVEKTLKAAGYDFATAVLPWARAYREAETTKNTLIYSIVRTPGREDKFHWLGVLSEPKYYLFALKNSEFSKSSSMTPYKNHRIGTLLNSASYHSLKDNGFTHLIALNHTKNVFELLKKKRVDFVTANKRTFKKICSYNTVECDEIVAVAPITMPKNSLLYLAINKESDPHLVKHLKVTYDKLIASGDISVF